MNAPAPEPVGWLVEYEREGRWFVPIPWFPRWSETIAEQEARAWATADGCRARVTPLIRGGEARYFEPENDLESAETPGPEADPNPEADHA